MEEIAFCCSLHPPLFFKLLFPSAVLIFFLFTRDNHSLHLLKPEIAQCMSILLRFTVPIKWLLAEMTGHLSLDTLRETRLAHIKDTLLEPIFTQLQGYPLRCLTTLNFSIFSHTKLDFTYYSLLCFVICSNKLYQGEAISLNVFPPERAICRDWFWSVKMDTSLDLTMTDGWFSSEVLRSLPSFQIRREAECYESSRKWTSQKLV